VFTGVLMVLTGVIMSEMSERPRVPWTRLRHRANAPESL